MDCRPEKAARSLVRIECIILQGILANFVMAVFGMIAIPFVPFAFCMDRWRAARVGWFGKAIRVPLWFCAGAVVALLNPVVGFVRGIRSIGEVARVEWSNRWMAAHPKRPDGRPLPIRTAEEQNRIDEAVFMGVIRDYNDEARSYGQGIDFG